MFPVEAFENTIGKFVAIAEAIGLPFHITGGSISSAYGEPRLTQDIDIVVSPDVARIRTDDLIDQLARSDFLFTERVLRQAVQTGNLFQLLDKTESLKLDIYPRELIPGELQRSSCRSYRAPMQQSRNSSGSTKEANVAAATFAASFGVARKPSKQTFEPKPRRFG
jgi:hypothetical protein